MLICNRAAHTQNCIQTPTLWYRPSNVIWAKHSLIPAKIGLWGTWCSSLKCLPCSAGFDKDWKEARCPLQAPDGTSRWEEGEVGVALKYRVKPCNTHAFIRNIASTTTTSEHTHNHATFLSLLLYFCCSLRKNCSSRWCTLYFVLSCFWWLWTATDNNNNIFSFFLKYIKTVDSGLCCICATYFER